MLRMDRVGFRYPGSDRWVLRDVSLEVAAGEVIDVAGRNGVGKSTLLRVAAGLVEPVAGAIVRSTACKAVYMDQFASEMLSLELTVAEQLGMASALGMRWRRADLEAFGVGLEKRPHEFVGNLSGGQRQIVALVCVAFSGATLLCLDEFEAALDRESSLAAANLLRQLTEEHGVASLRVSHRTHATARPRVLLTDNGLVGGLQEGAKAKTRDGGD